MGFIAVVAGALTAFFHPFYISMTDINHNIRNKTLEVSVRIFADDFENTLKKNCKCKVDLSVASNKAEMEKVVSTYINSRLKLKVDGNPVPLEFAGYQAEDGSIWNYFQVKNIASFKKIELYNSLLHDFNEEQINMLHISANGREQAGKLDFPKNTYSFSY